MKPLKTLKSSKATKPPKARSQKRKLPPDPDGTFKRAAARGKKVMSMYRELYPEAGRQDALNCLLFDLMNLCDRNPSLEDFDDAHASAFDTYETFKRENEEDMS